VREREMETFEFSLLQAFQAEGVKAGQGSGVLDSLTTTGAFHQLGNYKRPRWNENKRDLASKDKKSPPNL